MTGRQKYLLYTPEQISGYRTRYAAFISKYRKAYRDWFQSLPGWEWVRLPVMDERTAEMVIGILCILYIDDEINLTVDKTVTMVMRRSMSSGPPRFSNPQKHIKNEQLCHKTWRSGLRE